MLSMIDDWRKASASALALASVAALTLSGCGGSDGVASVTGQFVDAPVAGLSYKCGASTSLGTTDANGYYTCNAGDPVSFYVGDILLGSVASAQAVVTPLDLVGLNAKPTDLAVSNIVRFLLSISTADAAGNLVIDNAAVTKAKGKTVDFKNITSNDLDTMITTVKPGVKPVLASAAESHMRDSIFKLFAKKFTGSYSGSLSGTWSLSFDAKDGTVMLGSTYNDTVNGAGPITGHLSTDMLVSSTYGFTGMAGSAAWTGTLNVSTGVFSGSWDAGGGTNGTFTGKVAAAAPVIPTVPTASGFTPTAGAAGASFTISGSNLNAVTQVLFTGPSPSYSFVEGTTTAKTATSITATVPSTLAAGSYTVTVVHPGGEVALGTFTVASGGGTGGSGGSTGSGILPAGFVARANPANIMNTPSAVVWTGTEFVALEQSTDYHNVNAKFFVWKSADGINWTRETTDLPSSFISFSTANGKLFQLMANMGTSPTVSIAQSSNGINWTSSTATYVMGQIGVPSPMGVKYLNGRYFASLDVDTCMAISSTDAATWTSVDLKTLALPTDYYKEGNSKYCSEPFYIGGKYRIYGGIISVFRSDPVVAKGLIYSSTDGSSWAVETFALPTGANAVVQGGRTSTVVQVGNAIVLPSVMAQAARRINAGDAYATLVTDSNQVGTSTDGLTFTFADAVGITYRTSTIGKPGLTSYFPSINVAGLGVLGMEGASNFWTQDGVNYTAATQGYGLTMSAINYAYSPTLKRLVVIQRGTGLTDATIMTKDF